MNAPLTWANEAGHRCIDCPRCGQATRVERHGSRVRVQCFGGCGEDAILAAVDVTTLLAELERPAAGGSALRGHLMPGNEGQAADLLDAYLRGASNEAAR